MVQVNFDSKKVNYFRQLFAENFVGGNISAVVNCDFHTDVSDSNYSHNVYDKLQYSISSFTTSNKDRSTEISVNIIMKK